MYDMICMVYVYRVSGSPVPMPVRHPPSILAVGQNGMASSLFWEPVDSVLADSMVVFPGQETDKFLREVDSW